MKKLLSLLLVLSMCLTSVVLLASCTGKSAYEVAVENGFQGSEEEWLDSLKGATGDKGKAGEDGKDGKDGDDGRTGLTGDSAYENAVNTGATTITNVMDWLKTFILQPTPDGDDLSVTVDENGFWVVGGYKTLFKVDGTKFVISALELVENKFTAVKGNDPLPTVKVKYTLESGQTGIAEVGANSFNPAIDFSKEGTYETTLTYSGFSQPVTVEVEGLMVYFENFNSYSSSSTMAEILEGTGMRIPTLGAAYDSTGWVDYQGRPVDITKMVTWYEPDGVSLKEYTLPGYLSSPNYFGLSVDNGMLYYEYKYGKHDDYEGDNEIPEELQLGGKSASNSSLVVVTPDQLAYADLGAYTVQFDILFHANGMSLKEDSKGQTLCFGIKANPYTGATASCGSPQFHGIGFGNASRISAVVYTRVTNANGTEWYNGMSSRYEEPFFNNFKTGTQTVSILEALYPDSAYSSWAGSTITVRIAVKETTTYIVDGEEITDWGYTTYIKRAEDADLPENWVKVGEANAEQVRDWTVNDFARKHAIFAVYTKTLWKRDGFWMDNVAVWTGNGSMPSNKDTSAYNALNEQYLASLEGDAQ